MLVVHLCKDEVLPVNCVRIGAQPGMELQNSAEPKEVTSGDSW
jgi:hypothetical protein